MKLFGLADCNNFFVSCERAFRPDLQGRPVLVLSNNDGCVVSRSNEVKALGIKMGVPFYQIKDLVDKHNIAVFSSNYELYGDMSSRVMSMLSSFTPKLEQYSIDEAFLDFSDMHFADTSLHDYCVNAIKSINRGVHIPVSMGIAPTKTLAKMASKFAKQYPAYKGVCIIDNDEKREKALKLFPVADVFGIGRKANAKLQYYGVETAWDFTLLKENFVRNLLTIQGVRTWRELKGENALQIDELPEKKSICVSRSFSEQGVNEREKLEEAVSNFASDCARKLREQHSCCTQMLVFAATSRFRTELPSDYISRTVTFQVPTASTTELIQNALQVIRAEWKNSSYYYKKAGVIVTGISSDSAIQTSLFDNIDRGKQNRLQRAIDSINNRSGFGAVRSASQGEQKRYKLKSEHLSQRFSTNLNETIIVKSD